MFHDTREHRLLFPALVGMCGSLRGVLDVCGCFSFVFAGLFVFLYLLAWSCTSRCARLMPRCAFAPFNEIKVMKRKIM